jgi:hypothetical protein
MGGGGGGLLLALTIATGVGRLLLPATSVGRGSLQFRVSYCLEIKSAKLYHLLVSGLITENAVYRGSTLEMVNEPLELVTRVVRFGTPVPKRVIVAPTTPTGGLDVSTTLPLRNGKVGFCPGGGMPPLLAPLLFPPLLFPPPPPPPQPAIRRIATNANSAEREMRTWGDCHNTDFLIYLPAFRYVFVREHEIMHVRASRIKVPRRDILYDNSPASVNCMEISRLPERWVVAHLLRIPDAPLEIMRGRSYSG